jgi:tetratricopeptide (TPR) repeat protein
VFARVIILWLVLLLRAQAATQSVIVNYDDHSSQTFQYLAETKSNLIVEIAGQPVFLPWTNIVSLQFYSAAARSAAEAPVRSKPEKPVAHESPANQINAAIERWGLVCLAVLFFLRALCRFRTEGEFYEHRIALVVYLGMLAVLVAGGIAGWGNGCLQMVALALVLFFGKFYTNQDLVERRSGLYFWLAVLVLAVLAGAGMGFAIWSQSEKLIRPGTAMILGAIAASLWPLYQLAKYLDVSVGDFIGGLRADMLLSEGAFAEKNKPKVHIPSDRLLLHWRENGMTKKAWQTARQYLLDDPAAFPIWLFAMETAALHLKKTDEAVAILRRLWHCKNFSADQQNIALMKMQDLAMKVGFQLSEKDFHQPPVAKPEKPLAKILELRQKGRFAEAESMLLVLVEKEPDNPAVFTQLIRLYAEDLKLRGKAQLWISNAEEHLPAYHVDFLRNSLEEWICSASTPSIGSTGALPCQLKAEPSGKLVLKSYNTTSEPAESSVEDCLQRQRIQAKPKISNERYKPPRDKMDEMVADRRYGTAEEMLKMELKAKPENFDLWLRYAEVHGLHCGNIRAAEKVIEQMFQLRVFSEEQMQAARAKLKEWRVKHPVRLSGW